MALCIDTRFRNVPQKTINIELIEEFIQDPGTKRINFAHTHQHALKEAKNGVVGWLNLPFDEPFETIAEKELGLDRVLFPPKSGTTYYRRIDDIDSFKRFQELIDKYKDLVFLRDCLDLSVALSMHESAPRIRTVLGQHEYNVKYNSDKEDTSESLAYLIAELQKRLEQLPYYKEADYICAIPSSKPFMQGIIRSLRGFSFQDISEGVQWTTKTGSLKDVDSADEKLNRIDSWGLCISPDLNLSGKNVLLVDDMYKSGISMQYVGMKLKEAGAARVFGMALVKALGNQ